MTRRVLAAIVAVAALAVIGIGLPLAITVAQFYRTEADTRLEREATAATIEVPAGFLTSSDRPVFPNNQDQVAYALYLPSGRRLQGNGPRIADATVRKALANHVTAGHHHGFIVVAVPVTSQEQVIGIVRAAQPQSIVNRRIRRAWLAMSLLGLFVVGVSTVLALGLARHLSRPVSRLADSVTRLGQGDFASRTERSGIAELDRAAAALDETADRLGRVLARERAFSADASHQLRTPLTGLRIGLEIAKANPDADLDAVIDRALEQTDRLESTIDDLLHLARDLDLDRTPIDLGHLVRELDQEWSPRLADTGRSLVSSVDAGLPEVAVSEPAVRQILDVLLANASVHGAGPVSLRARASGGGVAIEVSDDGPGVSGDGDKVFARRESRGSGGHGIGLALARSLAEAEGGRLHLRATGPHPTFVFTLSAVDPLLA